MCKYLIKFTSKKKYANDLLDGKLYMHSARYYHKLELEKGLGQGDLAEGTIFNNAQIHRFIDCPLFCMYSVETDDIIEKTISIPYRLVNDFECEKGYLILIDYNCFIEDIKSCNTNGFSLYAGRVLYGSKGMDVSELIAKSDKPLGLFAKRSIFKYQQEFRIVIMESLCIDTGLSEKELSKVYFLNKGIRSYSKKYCIESLAKKGESIIVPIDF